MMLQLLCRSEINMTPKQPDHNPHSHGLLSSTIISSAAVILSILITILIIIMVIIVRHHPANCHASKHTRSGSHRKTSSHSHATTALSSLRLAVHLLLRVSTVAAAHHRLLPVHRLLAVAASHHRLLTVALLGISASAVVLLLSRSRASAAKLRGDLGEQTALLFPRWQLALLAVWAWAAHPRLLL
jgi:hypothetical protein